MCAGAFWFDENGATVSVDDADQLGITDAAKLFGVSTRTLRYYENRGLFKPHRRGWTRVYGKADCHRIAAVLKARKLGFSLAEIKDMLAASDGELTSEALRRHRERCMRQIELLAAQRSEIEQALAELWRIHTTLSALDKDEKA
jgi:DNA-binding transcriptional MerR regulator